jgi:antitoxin YefM
MYITTVQLKKYSMTYTYTHARAKLAALLNTASEDNEIIIITRRHAENVALISENELTGLLETAHLLRSPKNALRLHKALERVKTQNGKPQSLAQLKKAVGIDKAKTQRATKRISS